MDSSSYDQIAKSYLKTDSSLTKKYVATPTFMRLVGKTKDKRVIDFGCGSGYSTRLITNAIYLMGIDSSHEQIILARDIEKDKNQGIIYKQLDISKDINMKFKAFDKATAFYLLHYASTKEELYTYCKNIARFLKSGGKLIVLNSNPEYPEQLNRKYGVVATLENGLVEGTKRKVTYLINERELCSFNTYFWSKKTYEEALQKAGFRNIEWHIPLVSKEGVKIRGKEFWKELLEEPFICGLTAIKS